MTLEAQTGPALRKLREKARLSIYDVANKIHVHPSYLAMIERGERAVKPAMPSQVKAAVRESLAERIEADRRLMSDVEGEPIKLEIPGASYEIAVNWRRTGETQFESVSLPPINDLPGRLKDALNGNPTPEEQTALSRDIAKLFTEMDGAIRTVAEKINPGMVPQIVKSVSEDLAASIVKNCFPSVSDEQLKEAVAAIDDEWPKGEVPIEQITATIDAVITKLRQAWRTREITT